MHPSTFRLAITPGAPPYKARYARMEAWEVFRRGMSATVRTKSGRRVLHYAELQATEHWAYYAREYLGELASEGRVDYAFSDEQGNASVYCELVPHWMQLVLALRYEQVKAALWRGRYELITPKPELSEVLDAPTDAPFVVTGGFHARLAPGTGGQRRWRLRPDLEGPSQEALSERDVLRLDNEYDAGLCRCDFCRKLRG